MNRKCVRGHSELFESLFSLEDDLTDMNIDVFLAWIPGHSGIQYNDMVCLLYTSPSPRDRQKSRMPSSA